MALESANYVSGLVATNPSGSDSISQGDDHLRLIKDVLKNSFPDADQAVATVVVKATAPTTQVKGTIWYDTGNDKIYINTAATGASPSWAEIGVDAPWSTNPALNCMFRATMDTTQSLPNNTYTIITKLYPVVISPSLHLSYIGYFAKIIRLINVFNDTLHAFKYFLISKFFKIFNKTLFKWSLHHFDSSV